MLHNRSYRLPDAGNFVNSSSETQAFLATVIIVGDLRADRVAPPVEPPAGHADRRTAVFFDIDGVLNEEPGGPGVLRPDDLRLFPGAADAVRRVRAAGYRPVGVTNRAQVAKGLVSFERLEQILVHLQKLLSETHGSLDRIYVCPHFSEPVPGGVADLCVRCECRKPGTLLFRRAIAELGIDAACSMLIGDSLRDIGAARALGLTAYGVRTGYGCTDVERYRGAEIPRADRMFDTVVEAVDYVTATAAI